MLVELTPEWLEILAKAACTVSRRAYVPYSHFPVGAAVLTSKGEVFSGCNVENASYGLSMCAERNAVFHAVTHQHARIVAVVIYTPTETATSPCGACRQVIHEFGPGAKVIAQCDTDHRLELGMTELLPFAFGPEKLANMKPAP